MHDEHNNENDMGPGKKTVQFNVSYSEKTVERIKSLCRELGHEESPGALSALAVEILLTIRERQGIAPIIRALVDRS